MGAVLGTRDLKDRAYGLMVGIAAGNLLGIVQEVWPRRRIAEVFPDGVRDMAARPGYPDDDDLAQAIPGCRGGGDGRSTSTAELGLAGDDALTNSDTWDVRWPGGASHIVYERNGELRVHTIDAGCRDPSPVRRRTTARRTRPSPPVKAPQCV